MLGVVAHPGTGPFCRTRVAEALGQVNHTASLPFTFLLPL